MKKIYLASASRARKELFKLFGFKFKVLPSKVKEKRSAGNLSYGSLVKANALKKAKHAASKIKSGIVIAADTIVVQDKSIFGKPRNLKEAKAMLKRLSSKPHRLYTGIAVIDKDKFKILTDYEETKVYMDKLTDEDIENYFSKVSPLDKAGSYDIQGRGAFFIRRIEGCFYNVVGLPLRKLYRMLKVTGVILSFAIFLTLSGCSTEYNIVTNEQESYYYSTDKEVAMGAAIAKEVVKEFKLIDDPLVQKRAEDIGKKIAAVCDRKEIDYHFFVLKDEEVNAFSLPGGYVYINKGLIDKVSNDDELAGVIAHEVGHIVARHAIKRLQGEQMYSVLRILTAVSTKSGEAGAAADVAFTQMILGYSREDEFLADKLGAKYSKLAGYNPDAMISFLKKLQDVGKRRPLTPINYFKTHPYVPDRIRAVKEELGEGMNFGDFINIQDQPRK